MIYFIEGSIVEYVSFPYHTSSYRWTWKGHNAINRNLTECSAIDTRHMQAHTSPR